MLFGPAIELFIFLFLNIFYNVWVKAETLPEIGEYVFIIVGTDTILKGRLMCNGWTAFFADGEKLVGDVRPVTYWMPLPLKPAQ